MTGDFNARTKDLLDFIPDDNINNIFQTNVDYITYNFEIHQNNKDSERYNAYGKSLIEYLLYKHFEW